MSAPLVEENQPAGCEPVLGQASNRADSSAVSLRMPPFSFHGWGRPGVISGSPFFAERPLGSDGARRAERGHFRKTCVAVLRNKSRAAHWSPLVHWIIKMATIPVAGLTDKSVP